MPSAEANVFSIGNSPLAHVGGIGGPRASRSNISADSDVAARTTTVGGSRLSSGSICAVGSANSGGSDAGVSGYGPQGITRNDARDSGACGGGSGGSAEDSGSSARGGIPQGGTGGSRVWGLEDFLEGLRLSEYVTPAAEWAIEMGAAFVEEIVDNAEDFSDALGLKPLERKRLERQGAQVAAQIARRRSTVEAAATTVAPALAIAPAAPVAAKDFAPAALPSPLDRMAAARGATAAEVEAGNASLMGTTTRATCPGAIPPSTAPDPLLVPVPAALRR
eukprot:TRINITY_DN34741_c0_g1_i1.p1 TRINITY_DN34741_c0_g1~~TRINITY_DN34741_c0_g1_i1.p1  ORF type:complete len:278 (+),score=51.34 TRINITY_DN34741_c0_g1_i1:825-1658(+)